jgi:putative glycosyltransferase
MKLSIVTTLYNSAGTIRAFHQRAIAAAEALTKDFEIVMVDDGSPDESLALARSLMREDPRIRIVELSRNFGHHKAMMTGLAHARGELVFLIDSDLEEDPALLGTFHERLNREGADVVYGFQEARKGGVLEQFSGYLAFRLFDLLISPPIPRNHITVRLMTRDYVDSLLLHREQQTVIGGLWVITGYRQLALPVAKLSRKATSYSFARRWIALIDSISSFSAIPLVAIFYLGLAISAMSSLVALVLLVLKLVYGGAIQGWVSVMLSVWFLGGLLIFCVGLIGIYVSKIFIETKGRPYTIVRRVHEADRPSILASSSNLLGPDAASPVRDRAAAPR